jgi:hypothetical protein
MLAGLLPQINSLVDNDLQPGNNKRENQMTISLLQLWMPILLGTFRAWIESALIHVVNLDAVRAGFELVQH